MKILHTADMHLGVSLTQFGDEGMNAVKSHIDGALTRLEDMLKSGGYDGVILAGDIFENEDVSRAYMMRVVLILEAVLKNGGFACYASGNHDYWISESKFSALLKYPKFCLFCAPEFRTFEFEHASKKLAISGIGYACRQPARDISDEAPSRGNADISILIAHGEVTKSAENSVYYSFDPAKLKLKNHDYVAFGHVHGSRIFDNSLAYPGCPFPQGFDETGKKSVLDVEITEDYCRVSELDIAEYEIKDLKLDIRAENLEKIILKTKRFLSENEVNAGRNEIVRLNLTVRAPRKLVHRLDDDLKESIFNHNSAKYAVFKTTFVPEDEREEGRLNEMLESALERAVLNVRENAPSLNLGRTLVSSRTADEIIEDFDIKRRLRDDLEDRDVH